VVNQARETMIVRRVYGDQYKKDGVMIIPVGGESSLKNELSDLEYEGMLFRASSMKQR
jgi:hypothetical protein